MANIFAPTSHAPEADSYPIADVRSEERKSELEGSPALGFPSSPSPAVGSNSTSVASAGGAGKEPPQYSPVSNLSPPLGRVNEEPQELWGGYVPYRPGRSELPSERGK